LRHYYLADDETLTSALNAMENKDKTR